jgi:hypothetical protein
VKIPFGRLMEMVAALPEEDWDLPMGVIAERWGETAGRIGDAIDALKVLNGKPSYQPWPAADHSRMRERAGSGSRAPARGHTDRRSDPGGGD